MAATVIESLVTKLGFDFDDEDLETFNAGIETAVKGMTALVVGATAAAAGIFAFTKSVASANDETGKLSQRIGVDLGAMQELGYAAELNGGSIDSMNSSMENLSRITSEASRGIGAGVEVFGMLGLSATDAEGKVKSADDMMMEISDSISMLGTQAEKLEFTQKLGIGSDLLLALENGSDAIMRQREEARALGFVIDKNAAGAAANFNDELLRVTKVVKGVASAIGTKLMKQITPMMKIFTEWFKLNKKFIQQGVETFFSALTKTISGVFNIAVRVFNVINSLVQAFGGWENAIKIATGALIALNATALFIPILIAAAAAAIFLLIEDVQKFAQGGDSALGNLIERFPALEAPIRGLISLISMVGEGWKLLFTQSDEALEGMIMMVQDLISWVKELGGIVADAGIDILNKFVGPLNKGIDLLNKIPGVNIGSASQIGQNPVPTASAGSQTAIATNNTTNNTSKPSVTINVDGGNPADVKQAVKDALDEQYAGAESNLQSEVEV